MTINLPAFDDLSLQAWIGIASALWYAGAAIVFRATGLGHAIERHADVPAGGGLAAWALSPAWMPLVGAAMVASKCVLVPLNRFLTHNPQAEKKKVA